MASTTPGAEIRFTTDGSDPLVTSQLYTQPVEVAQSLTLKALALAPNYDPSYIATAIYTIDPASQAAAPTITPNGGTFCQPVVVTLETYAGIPLVIDQTGTVLTARACMVGIVPSAPTNATYTLEVAPVSFLPGPGNVTSGTPVSFGTITNGATFRYRTDGIDPTCTTGEVFDPSGSGLSLTQDTTFRVIACKPGYGSSAVAVGSYVIAE
jgi:hypothetical protein